MSDQGFIVEGVDANLDRKYKFWRIRAFLGTWLAYAGFYLCRKTIAVAQPEYMKQFGWNLIDVGIILSGYLTAYAIGQFINGVLGDKMGARRILAIGFGTTILMNLLFGFSSLIFIMFLLWTINGYAQSCGWPSVVKGMSNWFSIRERGKVMGPWGTCYTVGDVVGTGLAAFVIGRVATTVTFSGNGSGVTFSNLDAANKMSLFFNGSAVAFSDWRWVFWVGAITLTAVAAIVFLIFHNKPEDVGLPNIAVYHNAVQEISESKKVVSIWENTKDVLSRGPIWILGFTYFGIKLIRYTFMFMIVTYLATERGFATETAGYISTLFALVGIFGTFIASYLSDVIFRSRRAPISVIMLLGLVCSLFFFWKAPISLIPVAMGLVGFMTYGPDFVVSAVAVMDFGSRKGASTAAGFVNGMGSIGAAFMPMVVGVTEKYMGWDGVFFILIGFSVLCAALMATLWNKVGTN